MEAAHIVKIIRPGPAKDGLRFVPRDEIFPPEFPTLAKAKGYAQECAQKADCQMRIIVEEKQTGRRKIEYRADGKGTIECIPLVW